jgi:hypothetical protein
MGFVDGEWQDSGVRGRVFVVGLPNSGKSFLLSARVRAARRVIVYNAVGADSISVLVRDGFTPVSQPGELRDGLARTWGEDFRFIYTPRAGDGMVHFEAVNEMVRKCGKMVYAIDEVDKYQQPGWAPPMFYELLNYGRHCQVAMIGSARRPQQVSKEYTDGLREVCSFIVTEPSSIRYFEQKIGAAATSELPGLGKYEYLRWMQDATFSKGVGW